MRLVLVLGVAVALTMAGLAFTVAVCLTTAAIVWTAYAVVAALPDRPPAPSSRPERST